MRGRAVVIGGSIAGLASGVGLARRGWSVTVVERDPTSPVDSGDEAFTSWNRRGAPQFQQGHLFMARSRTLLLEHLPDVVDRLTADGIESRNVFKELTPEEQWIDDDDAFTGLWSRRPAFELALRRTAEAEPGVAMRSPAVADGLAYDRAGALPRVRGVRLEGGELLEADLVLDCGGRRTPVPLWLHDDLGLTVREDTQKCDLVYYTRYFRRLPGSPLPTTLLWAVRGELDRVGFAAFTGDHDTFGLVLTGLPDDPLTRQLRHTPAWEALARSIPAMAPWVDPDCAVPLHEPNVMALHRNIRRHYTIDGQPLVSGLLAVGDALCTTNPQYGWGASMALTYAFAAVDAASNQDAVDDVASAYDQTVSGEADAVFREAAATDRARTYRWRKQDIPEWDQEEMERQSLIEDGVVAGARDPVLRRALLRRFNLIDGPEAVLDAPGVRARAVEARAALAARPSRRLGPSRSEMRSILAKALNGS